MLLFTPVFVRACLAPLFPETFEPVLTVVAVVLAFRLLVKQVDPFTAFFALTFALVIALAPVSIVPWVDTLVRVSIDALEPALLCLTSTLPFEPACTWAELWWLASASFFSSWYSFFTSVLVAATRASADSFTSDVAWDAASTFLAACGLLLAEAFEYKEPAAEA